MDILSKLKKDKKSESILDAIVKKQENKDKPPVKSADVEVTQLTPDKTQGGQANSTEPGEKGQKREFRTEGMHEFDIESLGTSAHMSTKLEYKARISIAIDEGKFDEAISLIQELRQKITQG